jgi:putative Mg2+ transporter-C (MgtC) family protein
MFSAQWWWSYWSLPELQVNLAVFLNLLGALLLGLLVGYERSYHGRAAGMRTYGIVCMAAAALTVFVGYPDHWYGGLSSLPGTGDPTRVVQGIVTGVGFLGAGLIMKEGLNISGLTTAASIWASSVIGVLVGVGFYAAAILLAVLSASLMMWGSRLESCLPSRHAISVEVRFVPGHVPDEAWLRSLMLDQGYQVAGGSMSISAESGESQWRLVAVALNRNRGVSLPMLAGKLQAQPEVARFALAHARN